MSASVPSARRSAARSSIFDSFLRGFDADGGAQIGAVIAHGSSLSVGSGVQAAFQSLIPP